MNLKPKHYPHPVLESQFADLDPDFNKSHFDISINYRSNENKTELIIESIFDLENESLSNLIKEKKATFALLFICESTSIRIMKKTFSEREEFCIPTRSLNKTVMIYPFVLANGYIGGYKNTDLISPQNDLEFQVKKGDILAIAANEELYIEKDAPFEVGSIFEFIKVERKNAPLLSFVCNQPKIQIYLPSKTYEQMKVIAQYQGPVNKVLINLFYVPAVLYSLQTINSLKESDDFDSLILEYKDFNWYRTLELKLIDLKLGDDLLSISEDKVIDVAYRLMEDPINHALEALDNMIFDMREDE